MSMSDETKTMLELRSMLDERGANHNDYFLSTTAWMAADGTMCSANSVYPLGHTPCGKLTFRCVMTPQQAIDATLGPRPKEDDPHNYVHDESADEFLCPDGMVPKIPNMPIGANPDWVDWVASLWHGEKPASIQQATERIAYEAICCDRQMPPNDDNKLRAWEQLIFDALGHDAPDALRRLMSLRGGHYSWPRLYEAVTGERLSEELSPSASEDMFIEKLIGLIGSAALGLTDNGVPAAWEHDGTLHVKCRRVPERIKVTLPDGDDELPFEPREKCEDEGTEPHCFVCSHCGHGLNWHPNYCPICGREVAYE